MVKGFLLFPFFSLFSLLFFVILPLL